MTGPELSVLADTVCGMSLDVHETLTGMFVARPWLAHEIIADVFSVDLPQHEEVRLDAEECTDPLLAAYRPDVVVLVGRGRPVLAVAVEVQLERDEARRESWPARVATTSARLGCPTLLLAICLDRAVATWCAEPIEVGPGATVRPFVLGPDQLPEVTSPLDAYPQPELAVLWCVTRAVDRTADVVDVLHAVFDSLIDERVPDPQPNREACHQLVMDALPPVARPAVKDLWLTRPCPRLYPPGRREYFLGWAESQSRALLSVLETLGIETSDEVRDRITGCRDLDQLDAWIDRVVAASTGDDLIS